MFRSLAVGFPRDIQPIRATLVAACASTTSDASTAPRAIMRRTVTCLGFMVASPSVFIADAERSRSALLAAAMASSPFQCLQRLRQRLPPIHHERLTRDKACLFRG